MEKPRIKIDQWQIHFSPRREGMELTGIATDHPRLGTGRVWTSRILHIDMEKWEVETLNSIYELSHDTPYC